MILRAGRPVLGRTADTALGRYRTGLSCGSAVRGSASAGVTPAASALARSFLTQPSSALSLGIDDVLFIDDVCGAGRARAWVSGPRTARWSAVAAVGRAARADVATWWLAGVTGGVARGDLLGGHGQGGG